MSTKQVKIGTKPTGGQMPPSRGADGWVERRSESKGSDPMKRLTLDIPASLHRRIKVTCANHGTKMADELRELLLQKYPKE